MSKYNDLFYWKNKTLHINYSVAIGILSQNGIYRYVPDRDNPNGYFYVKIETCKVHIIGIPQLKNTLIDYIKKHYSGDELHIYLDKFLKASNQLFSKGPLEILPEFKHVFYQDDKDTCYLFYNNTIIENTKQAIRMISYASSKKVVWAKQIIERDIKIEDSIVFGPNSCVFEQFINNVCDKDPIRNKNLELAIGYVLHRYKNPSEPKAVILYDEQQIGAGKRAEGRTGKGIIIQAISKFRKVDQEDGKFYNSGARFVFQAIGADTQVLVFDDVSEKFSFEQLFSIVTQGISVEKKFQIKFYIPYSKSPKIIITSNYILPGSGASHDGRRIEIELSHHYDADHTPLDDFGHIFFEQWDDEEWNKFDNYMIRLIQNFLREGLHLRESPSMKYKRLARCTSGPFAEFCEGHPGLIGREINFKELFEGYKSLNDTEDEISSIMFTKYMKEFANVFKLEYQSRKSDGEILILLSK